MKKIYLLFITFCLSITTFSQNNLSSDYDYSISKPYKVIDGGKNYFVFNNEMMAIKTNKKTFNIQKFNTGSLEEISREEYKISDILPKNFFPEGILQLQDKCYYFYSSWSGRKTEHERLYYLEIDFKSGKIANEAVKLVDVAGKLAGSRSISVGFFASFGVKKFEFLVSRDSSKVLVNYRKNPKVKRDTKSKDIIGIHVFDANLNSIWKNDYKMPYTERRMDLLDFVVDNKGHGYILSKVFQDDSNSDKKKKKDKDANYDIELFKLSKESTEIETTKIALENVFINGIRYFESKKGQLYCVGFYNKGLHEKSRGNFLGKSHKKTNTDGLFLFKVTNDGKLSDAKYVEIPVDVINQYVSDKTKNKNEKKDEDDKAEFESLVLRNIVVNEDDSVILIGEQYFVITRTYTSMKGNTRTTFTYYYNDMLISKIDANGQLVWMKKLPKRQKGTKGMGGMSFSYFNTANNHQLIFLDNVKNIDLPLDKIPALHTDGQGGYLTAYKLSDDSGEVSKSNIFDTRNLTDKIAAHQFDTDRIIKIAEDEFLVEVYKKKKEDVLIKVKIK